MFAEQMQQEVAAEPNESVEVSSEPTENQMSNELAEPQQMFGDESGIEPKQEEDKSFVQKRIDSLTAKKYEDKAVIDDLKREIDLLKEKSSTLSQSKEPELSDSQVFAEIQKAAEEGDWTYHAQLNRYLNEKKINEEKQSLKSESEEYNIKMQQQAEEWQGLCKKYQKYGIDKKDSDLYKLSEVIFKEHPGYTQSQAVSEAFLELIENNQLMPSQAQQTQQQLLKERRRNQLGVGGSGSAVTNPEPKNESDDDYNKNYIQSRIKASIDARGGGVF